MITFRKQQIGNLIGKEISSIKIFVDTPLDPPLIEEIKRKLIKEDLSINNDIIGVTKAIISFIERNFENFTKFNKIINKDLTIRYNNEIIDGYKFAVFLKKFKIKILIVDFISNNKQMLNSIFNGPYFEDNYNLHGQINYETKEISINIPSCNGKINESFAETSLMHEIMHAFQFNYNNNFNKDKITTIFDKLKIFLSKNSNLLTSNVIYAIYGLTYASLPSEISAFVNGGYSTSEDFTKNSLYEHVKNIDALINIVTSNGASQMKDVKMCLSSMGVTYNYFLALIKRTREIYFKRLMKVYQKLKNDGKIKGYER